MCGVCGFIGISKNPKITYQIMTTLLQKTESRGVDATGFWAAEGGAKGKIIWNKEPTKATEYVKKDYWSKKLPALNPVIMVAHCRQPTKMGDEKFNKNNHPHVSDDHAIALVHNGKIPEHYSLKSQYDMESTCDSEVLLRMFEYSTNNKEQFASFEANTDPHILYRLSGIKDIFAKVNYGAMAVAIGEFVPETGERYLWLFRDEDRPLHVIDMQEHLGQIFFCSTDKIWEQTFADSPDNIKNIFAKGVIVFPSFQSWVFKIDSKNTNVSFNKFKITRTKSTKPISSTSESKKEKKTGIPPTEVIFTDDIVSVATSDSTNAAGTSLTTVKPTAASDNTSSDFNDPSELFAGVQSHDESFVPEQSIQQQDNMDIMSGTDTDMDTDTDLNHENNVVTHEGECKEIIKNISDQLLAIETKISNAINENSISKTQHDEIIESLDNLQNDIKKLEQQIS